MGTKYDTKYTNVVSILSIIYTNVVKYIYLIRVRDVCVPARKGDVKCQILDRFDEMRWFCQRELGLL